MYTPLVIAASFLAIATAATLGLEGHINVQLNPTNPQDNRTFPFRYIYNDQHFKQGGAVLILVQGNVETWDYKLDSTLYVDLAKRINAWIFNPDFRYSSKTRPFRDLTLENLSYNTVENTVETLAEFIVKIKQSFPVLLDAPVVVVGEEQGGSYASWLATAHPELVSAGWVSSAVLEINTESPQVKEELGKTWRRVGGDACYDIIETGIKEIEFDLERDDLSRIRYPFKICTDWTNFGKDKQAFMEWLGNSYIRVTDLYGEKYIRDQCAKMVATSDPILAVAIGLENAIGSLFCLSTDYNRKVNDLRVIAPSLDSRAAAYLKCYELGNFPTSSSPNQPFGTYPTIAYYDQWCRDIYDENYSIETLRRNGQTLNEAFKGRQSSASNIFYTQGQNDPLRKLGAYGKPSSPTEELKSAGRAWDQSTSFVGFGDPEVERVRKLAFDFIEERVRGSLSL